MIKTLLGQVKEFKLVSLLTPLGMLAEVKIKEANEIIAFCSDKLTKADREVQKLLSDKQES